MPKYNFGTRKKEPLAEYAKEIGLRGELEFYKDLAGFDRGFVYQNNFE